MKICFVVQPKPLGGTWITYHENFSIKTTKGKILLLCLQSFLLNHTNRGDRFRDFFSSVRTLINNGCKYSNYNTNKYSTSMFNAQFNCYSVLVIIYLSLNLKPCTVNEWLSSNFCNFPFYILLINFSEHWMREYYYRHLEKKKSYPGKSCCAWKLNIAISLFFIWVTY